MDFWSLVLIAVGLSMDAFAVSVCKGLAMQKITWKGALTCGLWFGGFQALMPLIGYFLGSYFSNYIMQVDHWIAFGLLAAIGVNMIREAFSKDDECVDCSLKWKDMLIMAIATSIDALAVGITFGLLPDTNIWSAISLIGVITCVLSMVGVKVGGVFGSKFKTKAELLGGVILILLGMKILMEHLGVFG